jgi:hypothetical protein
MSTAVDQLLRINGTPISWGSTRSRVNGLGYVGFLEANWEESREGEYVHGQQPDGVPLGITTGLYKVDSFSFKTLVDTGEQILQQLSLSASVNPVGFAAGSFGDARFTYQLEIFEPAGPTMMVTISGCKIEKRKLSNAKGTEALAYEFECKAQSIVTVGVGVGGLTGIPQQLWSIQRALV